jgi:hypothetical protein
LNSYNWHSGCPNFQMTAFVFFIFKSAGDGEFEGDSTWLIHYKKNTDSHPVVLLNSFKFCAPVVNDVYMSVLQCDIFWWKLIDRNLFNLIFNTKVVLRASPLFCSFHCFALIISKQDIQITQKKMKLSRKAITHPSFASFFVCKIKNN